MKTRTETIKEQLSELFLNELIEVKEFIEELDISVLTVPPISVYQCQAFRSISATYFGSNGATIPVLTVPL